MGRIGGLLRGAFGGPRTDAAALRRVKGWAAAHFDPEAGVAFAVNEIACTDPSCPGIETVILVMEPGAKTRAVKIAKGIEDVTEGDVRDVLHPPET